MPNDKQTTTQVRLTHPDNHPIVIGISLNERMCRYDIEAIIGNFQTRTDGEKYAARLKRLIEDDMDTILGRA